MPSPLTNPIDIYASPWYNGTMMINHTPSTNGSHAVPCENCGVIASPLTQIANLRLCRACAEETKDILESKIPAAKPEILWLAIDTQKLSTFGLATDSGEWLGKFVVAALKRAGATELNNLASLFTAAANVAADAYKVEAAKHIPVVRVTTGGTPAPSKKQQQSWADLMAEI